MRFAVLVLAVAALVPPGCALRQSCWKRQNLYWYDYIRTVDEPLPVVPRVKTEEDPTLTRGDYVLTDGMIYRVSDMTWIETCKGVTR